MAAFAYSGVQAGKKINGQINASDIKPVFTATK